MAGCSFLNTMTLQHSNSAFLAVRAALVAPPVNETILPFRA